MKGAGGFLRRLSHVRGLAPGHASTSAAAERGPEASTGTGALLVSRSAPRRCSGRPERASRHCPGRVEGRRPGKRPRGASVSGFASPARAIRAGSTARASPGKPRHALRLRRAYGGPPKPGAKAVVAFPALDGRPAPKARSRRIPPLLPPWRRGVPLGCSTQPAAAMKNRNVRRSEPTLLVHAAEGTSVRGTMRSSSAAPRTGAAPD